MAIIFDVRGMRAGVKDYSQIPSKIRLGNVLDTDLY